MALNKPPERPFLPKQLTTLPSQPNINPEDGKLQTFTDHSQSDVDSSKFAQHHTLGSGTNQASPGSHNHDGINSNLIPVSSILELANLDHLEELTGVQWVSSGTQPALGNGTIDGKYLRLGALLYFSLRWVPGSTTTFGTGEYRFVLPFTFEDTGYYVIQGIIQNQGAQFPANAWVRGTNNSIDFITPADIKSAGLTQNSVTGAGWKGAWGTGDFMVFTGWVPLSG